MDLYLLNRNPAFERLVLPLNPIEYKDMEDEIKIHGGAKGVMVWGKTILVDYAYYDYCHKHHIPFRLIDVPLRSEIEAVVWICKNQLHRKSLTEEMRKYLIGRRSMADRDNNLQQYQKMEKNDDFQVMVMAKYAKYNTNKTVIREKIAKDYNLVFMTVRKYESYTDAIDTIYRFCPKFVTEHLAGRMRMSIEKIEKLSSLPMDVMCRECQRWLSEPLQIKLGRKREKTQMALPVNKFMELPPVSVKDMPVHDPDAELLSLILTIPSWQSSINRVKGAVDLRETSQETRLRLIDGLIKLNTTVFRMIRFLKVGQYDRL